jgi:hypothetical protein
LELSGLLDGLIFEGVLVWFLGVVRVLIGVMGMEQDGVLVDVRMLW